MTYQLRALNSDDVLVETTLEVPKEDLVQVIDSEVQRFRVRPLSVQDDFKLETSISSTLMEVMVGRQLLKVSVRVGATGLQFESMIHPLKILRTPSHLHHALWKLFLSSGAEFLFLLRGYARKAENGIAVDIFQDVNCRRNPLSLSSYGWRGGLLRYVC